MRIVFFFILTFATLFCNAQFTTVHTYSSQHTLETALGGLKVNRGFINTIYADTTTANLQPIKNYQAAQIWVNDTVYIRNITATKWIAIGAGGGGGGSGTVTSFSIVTANGFSGSVANSTTTPALTITTTITGLLKGNGTAISAAVAGTDYLTPTGSAAGLTSFPTLNQNTTGSAATLTTGRTIGITGDLVWTSPTFDGSANVTASSTLATVNSNTGSFGSSTSIPTFTVNAKGLITAASGNVVIAPAGTLTGTTLAANVVTSSLTSVGTISTGVWQGSIIASSFTAAHGIDDVLAEGQALTANRTIDVNASNHLSIQDLSSNLVRTSWEPSNGIIENVVISPVGDGNEGRMTIEAATAGDYVIFLLRADYQDGDKTATIEGNAQAAGATITYTADTHTFNAGSSGIVFRVSDGVTDLIEVDKGDGQVRIISPNSNIVEVSDDIDGVRLVTASGNAKIQLVNTGNAITYTADTHTFNLGGGTFNVVGGTAASGNAGNISLVAAGSNAGNDAGNVIVTAGLKADGAGGGDVIISSGSATTNDPGDVYLNGGSSLSGGNGGDVILTGGNGQGDSEGGGSIALQGGTSGVNGQGGIISVTAGNVGVGGTSGYIAFTSGHANETGAGGNIDFQGGFGGSTSGNGGNITFSSGKALGGDGNGGSIVMNTGERNGAGSFGKFTVNYMDGGDPEVMFDIDPTAQTITLTSTNEVRITDLAGNGAGVVSVDNDGDLSWIATPSGGGLTIGTTTITSGTNTRVLFNNSGVVGEYVISGTGNVAMTTSPTFTTSALWAGSTSGTITIAADALSNVISGTVLSGTGTIPVDYDIVTRADETLSNTTADQPIFTNTAHDVITILANTTYDFELRVDFTHGATAHNIEFGMIPTTATITSIEYNAYGWVTAVGTNTATQNSLRAKVTTTTQVIASGSNATETLDVRGTFTVGATGGSIMPTIQFSADPTGTVLLKTGARFKLTARGNETFTQKGPIN